AGPVHSFKKIKLTEHFWAEGAHFGDLNKDGSMDIVYGPFWFQGPEYKQRHEFRPAGNTFTRTKSDGTTEAIPGFEGALGTNNAYANNFLTYTYDMNGDGWTDILVYGFPGEEVPWYENPKGRPGHWQRHVIFDVLDNESPGFGDVTGDGKPEILCCSKGYLGYVEADWSRPAAPWAFRPVTPKSDYQRYTHGLGLGDINGDGRIDLVEKDAWWEQPASRDGNPVWKKHPVAFAPAAAQMLVYDVNADGLIDVITCVNAHGYGLVWHEQTRTDGKIGFREHVVLNKDATTNACGVQFSQVHALDLIDMDGDGLKDVVTGKRFWAHGPNGDPDPNGAAVLYWFQLKRSNGKAEFIPHLIDNDSGVGTQVVAGFVSNPKSPDVVVGNKKGAFLFQHQVTGK
ncbi:MAG TPA: VCBS repeat-containing protein, partial [Clostridia bacterium]|nr:VCBS repeat-containing protein [Clostridia bacterium]